jgi:hypothetical protein
MKIPRIIKRIVWPFLIRAKIKRMIRIVTSERECFKEALKWNVEVSKEDERFLESRIAMKNEVLNKLRDILYLNG